MFFISSAIYLAGGVIYGAFCSAEKQPWVVEVHSDPSFDTDAASVTTATDGAGYAYTNKAMDGATEM